MSLNALGKLLGIAICLFTYQNEKNKIMINIELFRHHNNHEDGARIIPTGSSGSVLPPAALWVAQSYRLTPGQGGLEGDVLNASVSPGVHCTMQL